LPDKEISLIKKSRYLGENTDRSSRLEGGDVLDRVAVKRVVLLLGHETRWGLSRTFGSERST
jgi:hypothetical protein